MKHGTVPKEKTFILECQEDEPPIHESQIIKTLGSISKKEIEVCIGVIRETLVD